MPTLNLFDVTVHYQREESPALKLAYMSIAQGERVVITGPSGSGKTTLINVISGLEKPDRGRIIWDDTELTALSAAARDSWRAQHVGLIMQDFHLYPGLNARDNILLPARFRRWRIPDALHRRADELLAQVGLTNHKRPIEQFSRGEIQRVAVARALLSSPPVLIADEPTASLDEKNGQQIIELLISLSTHYNATLIIVTHDHRLVKQLNRHIMLENGHIANSYRIKEVMQ